MHPQSLSRDTGEDGEETSKRRIRRKWHPALNDNIKTTPFQFALRLTEIIIIKNNGHQRKVKITGDRYGKHKQRYIRKTK